jgi:glucose-1-phosphate thymidylyltransferase
MPAAGRATRLAPLPCSKELLPVGYRRSVVDGAIRPKVASHYLLEKMQAAGAREVYIVVRRGKWDILEYYGDGAGFGMDIAYLVADEPLGPPFTLDHAYPFVRDATVLFGFPDILFEPQHAFAMALERLDETDADVIVGAYPPHQDEAFDVVEADVDGRVMRLEAKEQVVDHTVARRSWVFAVWSPTFTEFLHMEIGRLRAVAQSGVAGPQPEWPVGSTIDAAIAAGLHVNSIYLPGAKYTDIGKPERLVRAIEFPGVWNGLGDEPVAD